MGLDITVRVLLAVVSVLKNRFSDFLFAGKVTWTLGC